jgi:CysZ protein
MNPELPPTPTLLGIFPAFFAALAQLPSRGFLKVLVLGLASSILTLGLVWWGLDGWLGNYESVAARGNWWARALGWLSDNGAIGLTLLSSWFLFPAIATTMMGVLLDDIVDAVEDEHYPATKAPVPMGLWIGGKLGLQSGLRLIGINLVLVPVYIILSFTILGAFALYMAVNGYLLGRDYVQMVVIRHGGAARDHRFRRQNRLAIFAVGLITSALFLVPVVNLVAPLIGAAMATHLFHQRRAHA